MITDVPLYLGHSIDADPDGQPSVSAEGDRAAIARGNAVELYELPGGRLLRRIEHAAPVSAVAFEPLGRDLVSGAVDGSILITRDGGIPPEATTIITGGILLVFVLLQRAVLARRRE